MRVRISSSFWFRKRRKDRKVLCWWRLQVRIGQQQRWHCWFFSTKIVSGRSLLLYNEWLNMCNKRILSNRCYYSWLCSFGMHPNGLQAVHKGWASQWDLLSYWWRLWQLSCLDVYIRQISRWLLDIDLCGNKQNSR